MKRFVMPPYRAVRLFVWTLAMLATASSANAQVEIGDRIELDFSGRVHFQLLTSSCTDDAPDVDSACAREAPAFDMLMRRARFSLEATIDDRISLKVEPGFASLGGVSMRDAWGRYAFGSGLALKAGHFKRPFDGFHIESSSRLPFERALIVPGIDPAAVPSHSGLSLLANLSERDVGMMLEGAAGDRVDWWLGVFTGGSDSRSRDTNTEKQFMGRVQVALESGDAPLRVAGAAALTDAPFEAVDGSADAEYYHAFELWVARGGYDVDGLLVQAGLISGENPNRNEVGEFPDLAAGDELGSLLSWQAVGGYRFPVRDVSWLEAVSGFFRVSYADPSDADDDEAWGFTPGIALYFYRRNQLAISWDFVDPAGDAGSVNSFKAQMQFHF